ncbi:glycosyltransferase [Bacillus sp. 03113]|uniref:glycosyltransferase n=1 Tax=Bacillus sp. 03113 TaxID=2578211 RepID=UPI0011435467|nr:glycosyltransferase [Bacillus sp. 03113]
MHIGEYVRGGLATYIKEVIRYQQNLKEIDKIYLMLSETNSDKDFDLPAEQLMFYKYKRNIKNIFSAMRQIAHEINRIQPDIVHIHSTFAGLFVRLPLFLKRKKYKVVYCSHGWAFLMEISSAKRKVFSSIERILAMRTDKIINISLHEQNESLRLGFSQKKLQLINNGINTINRSGTIELDLNLNKINLLFVGRFDRQKGLDILIEFFKTYPSDNVSLYIIGSGILENSNLEIPEGVVNIGWIDNEKLDSYYQLFDAVIIPSRWEGFGLVAVEAMKNKKAIIVSDRGALPYLAKEDNGYVFSLNDLTTLKEILNSITKDDLKVKGKNGYYYYLNNFTSEIMNEQIINVYKKIL